MDEEKKLKKKTNEAISKIVFLGEASVGKSSFIRVINTGEFPESTISTIGSETYVKSLNTSNGTIVRLKIYDTAGQERFRSLAPLLYRDADIVFLLYSIENRKSFDSISFWYDSLQYDCAQIPEIFIIGNKADLVSQRKVPTEEAVQYAERIGATFYEISTKNDKEKIDEILNGIAEKISLNERNIISYKNVNNTLYPPVKTNKRRCC